MIRPRLEGFARGLLLAALCLSGGVAGAQEEAVVTKRSAELRDAANASARSVATLPAQTPLTRFGERQGPWLQVRTAAGATGWVHMFDLGASAGPTAAPSNAATGALRGVSNFFNRGSATPTTSATSTIGIRGLGAEDIANAQPNLEAVGRMESLRQNELQARQFASEAPLQSATVPALPAPPRPPSGASNQGQMP